MKDTLNTKAAMTQSGLRWLVGSGESSGKRVHQGSVFACVYELPQIHMGMRACVMHYLLYVIAPVHSNIRFSIRFIRCTHLIPGLWDTNALNVAKNNYT